MSCRSCDLKRIYKLFEEKKRREAEEAKALTEAAELERKSEEAAKRTRKKKACEPVEVMAETPEERINEEVEEEFSAESETIRTEESGEMM